jgi:hypothetical protein
MNKEQEEFYSEDNGTKINVKELASTFKNLVISAVKSNSGNVTAGRRFRLESIQLEKDLINMRKFSKAGNDLVEEGRKKLKQIKSNNFNGTRTYKEEKGRD